MSTQATPIARTVPVFLAAAHRSVRRALWALLESEPGIEPLAEIAELGDLRRLLQRVTPSVVIVDEAILGSDGIGALRDLVAEAPATAFVVLGMGDHPMYVARAREAGAADYVRLDEAERLVDSVVEAGASSAPSTPVAGGPEAARSRWSVVRKRTRPLTAGIEHARRGVTRAGEAPRSVDDPLEQ